MNWKFSQPKPELVQQFTTALRVSPELASVFINRDIPLPTAKRLQDDPYSIIDQPLPLANMKDGVEYVLSCIQEKRPVYIFADYDVDGLTAGYIAYTFLSCFRGLDVHVYYPERVEGYGLSMLFVKRLIRQYQNEPLKPCVLTVDNGITKKPEVRALLDAGFKVLVTDHHLPVEGSLPDCICIDPYLGGVGQNLCGASVFWNVARYIENRIGMNHNMTNTLLYAAAIGTLSDVMPLDTYNVALTKLGLFAMNSPNCTPNIRVFKNGLSGPIDGETITWTLAPLLNACGRMGNTQLGAKFFLSDDPDTLEAVLDEARNKNGQRKKLETVALDKTLQTIDTSHEVILIIGDEYPAGIHGLIAGRVSGSLRKPAIVLKSIDDTYSGSCRSNTVPINKLLQAEKEKGHVVSCGGHAFACGVSLRKDMLETLQESLDTQVKFMKSSGEYEKYLTEPELRIDGTLGLSRVNNMLRSELNKYAYDKKKWPAPVWAFANLELVHVTASKNNPDNVKLTVIDDTNREVSFWAWGMADKIKDIGTNRIDLAGQLREDFMHPSRTTLQILDVRPSASS